MRSKLLDRTSRYPYIEIRSRAKLGPQVRRYAMIWPKVVVMNAPIINRSALLHHIRAIEEKYRLTIAGFLPRGIAAHIDHEKAVDFLADKKPGLSLLDLASAEIDLGD